MFGIYEPKKSKRKINNLIDGQVSIFDIQIPEEKPQHSITREVSSISIDIEKYRDGANRIIRTGNYINVEFKESNKYRTVMINREGNEVMEVERKAPVHPFSQILYARGDFEINILQKEKAKSFNKAVLKRHGDENLIIDYGHKIISILPNDWTLEYKDIEIADVDTYKILDFNLDIKEMQSRVKLGDVIETEYGGSPLIATVCHIYDNPYTVNVTWNNKQTAIARCLIKRILRSA